MTRTTKAVTVFALVAATACRIEQTPRVDADDPANVARSEIELTLRTYQESLIAGDARAAAGIFTPAARLFLPDEAVVTGRGEIDRAMADRFAAESISDMTMELDGIDVVGSVAHQFGTMHQTVSDSAGQQRVVDARFAARWIRAADTAWRIDRLIINNAPAQPAADTAAAEAPAG